MKNDLETDFPPTRAEAERRVEAFRPAMGRIYAGQRNHDFGPARRDNISLLSPYLRRRLVLERDVVETALHAHGLDGAEKFIQEVFWRGYWKGWLERRPGVWGAYHAGLARDLQALERDHGLGRRIEEAENGRAGIACFDAWARELVETGYLHNHARMWFASIWIFTLELPWRVGADFFLRHLLDGDPASNTLGWRWVAGLHTKGKAYAAQGWNIAKFSGGRFSPAPGELMEDVVPLEEDFDPGPAQPVRDFRAFDPMLPSAFLLTEEDCQPESLGVDLSPMRGTATLRLSRERSPRGASDAVSDFDAGALQDAATRAATAGAPAAQILDHPEPAALLEWARGVGAEQIVTGFIPRGPVHDWLSEARPLLQDAGIALTEIRRDWDMAIWPHATAGFFKVKKQIPKLVADLY